MKAVRDHIENSVSYLRCTGLFLVAAGALKLALITDSFSSWDAQIYSLILAVAGVFLLFFAEGSRTALRGKTSVWKGLLLPIAAGLTGLYLGSRTVDSRIMESAGLALIVFFLANLVFSLIRRFNIGSQAAIYLLILIAYALVSPWLEIQSWQGYNMLIPSTGIPLALVLSAGAWTVRLIKGGKAPGDALPFMVMGAFGLAGIGLAIIYLLGDPSSSTGVLICGGAFASLVFTLLFYTAGKSGSILLNPFQKTGQNAAALLVLLIAGTAWLELTITPQKTLNLPDGLLILFSWILLIAIGHGLDRLNSPTTD